MNTERKTNLLTDLYAQANCPAQLNIDIAIVSMENEKLLNNCLTSIKSSSNNHNIKIHLWDNAMHNIHYKEKVDYYYGCTNNIGFIAPNNIMTKFCTSDYIIYINTDVKVSQGWIEFLIGHLHKLEIKLVGCQGQKLDQQGQGFGRFSGENMDFVSGWCFAMRKEDAQIMGPFDENLLQFALYEDADLCLRIKQQGYKIYALEAICAEHIGGATYSSLHNKETINKHAQINQESFLKKWKEFIH